MSRLTLRLPDSLHRQLEELATNESVSLNQYIVYALTRQITLAYTVQAVPEKAVAEQRAAYTALLQNLGQATFQQIQKTLDEREPIKPEHGLSPKVVEDLKRKLKANK
ncbi:MAG: type II toxin-antitoxin system HicB family antitoxin [Anaerolineae bacterium]|nr:type II toxin-antitoxin system HicB family antitoxin [Anaerolineae bacterium]MCI0609319.1 type II toxin-antitoxin system HicB family antitoxin [Anaerolineae bacterium]